MSKSTSLDAPAAAEAPPNVPAKPTTVEDWAAQEGTPDWLFASTAAYHGWAVGQEVSLEAYQAAVEKAAGCSTASLKDAEGKPTTGLVATRKK